MGELRSVCVCFHLWGEPVASGDPIITDGSTTFGGGVNSIKTTTLAGAQSPDGLQRNELAWLVNATVRDGGISPRWGWQPIAQIADGSELYQRGFMYDPSASDPYLVLQVGGKILQVNCDTGLVTNLSSAFGLTNPANQEMAYFCQAEEFLVIQPGDFGEAGAPVELATGTVGTPPLFWDGSTLWRSKGITNATATPASGPHINEIPAATCMCYYQGRLWYAQGRSYSGGDIVGSSSTGWPSGHVPFYRLRDSVLCVQENPLCVGGDGFMVPSNDGNIRALSYSGNLNTALGESQLYVFTHKAVYSLTVPVNRTDWIGADASNQPMQSVVQLVNGAVGDGSVVPVNGDLYFQSFEPGIRSLVAAIRYFQQPGNVQISANENRILQYNDRALLHASSGIEFDNRLLMTALPFETPVGVAHRAIVPLDFVPVSSFNAAYAPVWEGHYEGLDILQLFQGDFGGRQRAFAIVISRLDGGIYLWELTLGGRFENGDQRITMQIEFPAFTWGQINQMKQMVGGEVWIDRLYGTVEFSLDYRVDGETCWVPWMKWKECSARNSNEDANALASSYPTTYGSGYRQTIDFSKPPAVCSQMFRPSDKGFQFQPRLTVKGYCRVRGLLLHALHYEKRLYDGVPCNLIRNATPRVTADSTMITADTTLITADST